MLTWAAPFNICCFLDNHAYTAGLPSSHSYECLLAAGTVATLSASAGKAFDQLKEWAAARQDWIFGHFGYNLATETEPAHFPAGDPLPARTAAFPLADASPDVIGFPDLFFFVPEVLIELGRDELRIGSFRQDHEAIWQQIRHADPGISPAVRLLQPSLTNVSSTSPPIPELTPRFTRDEYLLTVTALQQHILRGDCYEINFCQEFFARPVSIDPLATWKALSQVSPNPFSAFYRLENSYLLCASPERFLKKTGNTLLSQPMKGTSPRNQQDPAADKALQDGLFHSAKDRSENVMVVDLVRNDLSRVCLPGSVRVTELFGVYPFPHVHQMISTITGELRPDLNWVDAIRATFPMGSMTGAPKNKVVQLIGQYERSRRGIFSGAVGYVSPTGDFDFNVVIRSILYNSENNYLSYLVGSGITFYSDPVSEYEECLVKAEGIKKALGLSRDLNFS